MVYFGFQPEFPRTIKDVVFHRPDIQKSPIWMREMLTDLHAVVFRSLRGYTVLHGKQLGTSAFTSSLVLNTHTDWSLYRRRAEMNPIQLIAALQNTFPWKNSPYITTKTEKGVTCRADFLTLVFSSPARSLSIAIISFAAIKIDTYTVKRPLEPLTYQCMSISVLKMKKVWRLALRNRGIRPLRDLDCFKDPQCFLLIMRCRGTSWILNNKKKIHILIQNNKMTYHTVNLQTTGHKYNRHMYGWHRGTHTVFF